MDRDAPETEWPAVARPSDIDLTVEHVGKHAHDDDIVIAPGGPRRRSTVHEVGPGYEVRRRPDGSLTVEPLWPDRAESEVRDDPTYFPDPADPLNSGRSPESQGLPDPAGA